MISWLQRKRLVSQGLACDKQRRTTHHVEWRTFLETHPSIRAVICFGYIGLAFFFGTLFSESVYPPLILLAGIFLLSSLLLLKLDLEEIWKSNSRVLLLLGSITLNLLISKVFVLLSMDYHHSLPLTEIVFWIPTAFAPLLITVLLGTRAGLYTVVVSSLIDSLLVSQGFSIGGFPRLIIGLIAGFTAVLFSRNVRRRGDLIKAGIAIGLASLFPAVAFGLISGSLANVLIEQAILGIGVGVFTAVVINSILPIVETVFNINTDLSWIELADLNHPLLRQLTLEAPGTYHHSLVVANLAEAAAVSIGANGTLCRVMAYFHDIGKLTKPEYFAENAATGENPHDGLSPTMSSLIIISHVKEGVDLAVKHRLKRPIIDAIREHHGNSKVYYFYRRALQMAADAKAGSEIMNLREEDVPDVPEANFHYPGPIPQSKETGLLMLADAIEGASRSLEKPTPQRIEDLVEELVAQRIADHQLDDSGLSLKELRKASETFIFTLKTMLHSRISYPKHESHLSSSGSIQSARRMSAEREEARPAVAAVPGVPANGRS